MSDVMYDLDAEAALLGSVFLSPDVVDEVTLAVSMDDFQADRHAVVFAALKALADQSIEPNIVNVCDQLRKDGTLDRAGGVSGAGDVAFSTPANPDWRRYAKIVKDYSVRRKLIATAAEIMESARDLRRKVPDVVNTSEGLIHAVSDHSLTKRPVRFRDALHAEWPRLQKLAELGDAVTGIPSGLKALDELTCGFQRGHLIILAGRPSMGKSALAMNVAVNAALTLKPGQGIVAVFSLEMVLSELVGRVISSEARVDGNRFKDGRFAHADWPKMANTASRVMDMPLWIDEEEKQSLSVIRAKCRRLARLDEGGIAEIVVDYLQYMEGDPNADSREQQVAEISRGLKALAKEFKCPVIALSQLNRSLEKREDKRPMMSDLRESGSLEQDADVCAFVYRDEVYNPQGPDVGFAEIIIGKQRGGRTGTARVMYDKSYTLFRDVPEQR